MDIEGIVQGSGLPGTSGSWLRTQIQALVRQTEKEVKERRDEWWKNQVLEFDEGCEDGKFRFLAECGITFPDEEYTITIKVKVPSMSLDDGEATSGYTIVDNWIDEIQVDNNIDWRDHKIEKVE